MAGKARYTIQLGDEIIKFEGPEGLTDEQIEDLADKQLRTAKPGHTFQHSVYAGTTPAKAPELMEDTKPGAIGSFVRNLPHDAFFNLDDEIAALGNAAGMAPLEQALPLGQGSEKQQAFWQNPEGFWAAVRNNMGAYKQERQADVETNPVPSGTGRVLGVLGSLPRAGAAVAARLPQAVREAVAARPVLSAMGAGTTGGAVSGAGAGEEGTRAQSAGIGGLAGLALGGATAAGMELIPAIGHYANILINKLPEKEAISQIIKALKRDGFDVTSPSSVQQLKSTLQEFTGKPVSLADIGSATRSRVGVGLRAPSAVQQQSLDIVAARQAGQGQRLSSDIRATVAPRTDVHAIDEQLVAQRAEEAAKLRDRALFEDVSAEGQPAIPPPVEGTPEAGMLRTIGEGTAPATARQSRIVDDPVLQQLARLPDAQAALKGATARAESERALRATLGEDVSDIPDITAGSDLDVRTFDYLKRFLDDEVNKLYKGADTSTFKAAQAKQVKNLRDAIRERLRTAVPEYGDYLDAYKGSSEMIDALEEGRSFDVLDPEQIATEQAGRSTAAQELYRVGTARNLLDKIRSTRDTAAPAHRILNSPEAVEQIAATGVNPLNLAQLNKKVAQERVLTLLPREVQGSQSMQRRAAEEDAQDALNLGVPFNPASHISWAGMIGRKILNRTVPARSAAINEELLPRLLETNPQAIEGIIAELEQQGNIAAARELRNQLRARQTAGAGGTLIGGMVALPALEEE